VTVTLPAVFAVPEAVSWVAETYVVVRLVAPNLTTEPFTNPLPCTVKVNDPAVIEAGVTPEMTGGGAGVAD
jgi:hypothetical protein